MNRSILRLAIPNILANLSIPLLSSVDTALVGQLPQIYFIGAVAVGAIIFNSFYWVFGFIRMTTTALTAQNLGEQNNSKCHIQLVRALLMSIVIGLILIACKDLIVYSAFTFIQASEQVVYYAKEYFYIRIWAAPATLMVIAFQGWFLGLQNAVVPLIITIFINGLNIIISYILIKHLGYHSDGAAWGTVIAQYSGLALAIICYSFGFKQFRACFSSADFFAKQEWKSLFNINTDIFIRTAALVFVFAFFTAVSAQYGDVVLAANTILMQLWMIYSYGIDGFAYAAESLIGKYIGEKNKTALRQAVVQLFKWAAGVSLAFAIGLLIFKQPIISIFTVDQHVIATALGMLIWVLVGYAVNFVSYLWDGIYLGATASKSLRNSMVFCVFILFMPAYYLTEHALGSNSLWMALIIFMVGRGLLLSALYSREILGKCAS